MYFWQFRRVLGGVLFSKARLNLSAAPILAGMAAFAVYLATLAPGVPAGDSGELITVAATHGVAHPPGYPLATMIGSAWITLFPVGSVAWRMNLLSALFASLAVALVASVVLRLTRSPWAALCGAWLLAFAPPLWKSAVVAEVFALNALLAAGLAWAFVLVVERAHDDSRERNARPALVLAFLTGLLVAHHHSLVLLALPVDLVTAAMVLAPESALRRIAPDFRRPFAPSAGLAVACVGCFALGIAPIAYVPLAAAQNPPLSWGDVHGVRDLLRLLLRADYGTFRLDALAAGHIADRSHALLYLESWWRDFGPLGIGLALIGVLTLRRRPMLAAVFAAFAVLQIAFFMLVHYPTQPLVLRGVVERFYVLPDLVLAIVAGLGAVAALSRVRGHVQAALGVALALAAALVPIALNLQRVSQRGNRFIEHLGTDVLASVPRDGVLFVQGDVIHNALAYLQHVDHLRPDVTVVDQELLTYDWYVRALRRRAPNLLPPLGTEDRYSGLPGTEDVLWIDHLRSRRPVAFFGLKDDSWMARYEMVPSGYVLLATPKGEAPALEQRVAATLDQLATFHLDEAFSRHDAWSFEARERPRVADFVARAATLVAQGPSASPELAAIARRTEAEAAPEPALLKAASLVRMSDPSLRDTTLAVVDLRRWLATGPTGPEADRARAWLESVGR